MKVRVEQDQGDNNRTIAFCFGYLKALSPR